MNGFIQKLKDNKSLLFFEGTLLVIAGLAVFSISYYKHYGNIELVGFALILAGVALGIIGYVQYSLNVFKKLRGK